MSVTIVAADRTSLAEEYETLAIFSFERRNQFWNRLTSVIWRWKHLEQEARAILAKLDDEDSVKQNARTLWDRPAALWRRTTLRIRIQGLRWGRDSIRSLGQVYFNTIATWAPYFRAFRFAFSIHADIFIASRPEAAVCAVLAAKLRRKRFVYYSFELYGEQAARSSKIVLFMEKLILRFAVDSIITQNECRARIFVKERWARVFPTIIHNYKAKQEVIPIGRMKERYSFLNGHRVVLYEGYIMQGRWLERLILAVNHLPEDAVLVLMGANKGKWIETHSAIIEPLVASGRLHILPPVQHAQVTDYCADADVGVITYDDSVRNNLYCEPGKMCDYIFAGVPVIGPAFPSLRPVIEGRRIGYCFSAGSPMEIASAIRAVLERPRDSWSEALRSASEEMTWESQESVLIEAVSGLRVSSAKRYNHL